MGLAELLAQVADLSLPQAAARFAAAGLPVFPCVPGHKRPLTEHGFHDATTDLRQVMSWWRRWPGANIGLPTGSASGVEVVDVDRKPAGSGFAAFERARRAGLAGGWLTLVRTPSGGVHAYYPADPDRPQPSWQAPPARVDFRGEGGYVVAPPSIVTTGDLRVSYALIGGRQPQVAPVDALALRNLLDPRPEPAARPRAVATPPDAERLAAWVAQRGEGERNRGLFWAACRMAEAGASPDAAREALEPAAAHTGLPPREVAATIRSAFRATHAEPHRASADEHDQTHRPAARFESQVIS
ncbi:MAG: bifunctional DNA primase/polymerase [Propionicimonas sp.]|nr:bifunctional DNA primase/polymerase [Propionicimonas sp.]